MNKQLLKKLQASMRQINDGMYSIKIMDESINSGVVSVPAGLSHQERRAVVKRSLEELALTHAKP